MKGEEEAREAAVRAELGKIGRANPNAIPLYIIVNSSKREEAVEQPLTLCNRESSVKDLLVRLHRKYPSFRHIYFFGREQAGKEGEEAEGQGGSKKKRKERAVAAQEPDRIIPIEESMMGRSVQDMHGLYKDPRGLLVIVVSEIALVAKSRQSLYEPILLVLAVLFGVAFLYLSFGEEEPTKNGSEIDYIV